MVSSLELWKRQLFLFYPFSRTSQEKKIRNEALVALCMMEPGRVGFGLEITKRRTGNDEKKAAVHEEMKRMSTLPANSSYATHRLRVLHKILNLISLQRTTSQDEELELLFAGLQI